MGQEYGPGLAQGFLFYRWFWSDGGSFYMGQKGWSGGSRVAFLMRLLPIWDDGRAHFSCLCGLDTCLWSLQHGRPRGSRKGSHQFFKPEHGYWPLFLLYRSSSPRVHLGARRRDATSPFCGRGVQEFVAIIFDHKYPQNKNVSQLPEGGNHPNVHPQMNG